MIGVSTSFRSEIVDSGLEIINAILELGVEAVELEYRITLPMLREILPLLKKRRVMAVSIHNYFPRPEGIPREKANGEFFSLSSLDKEERELAMQYTRRSIEWAEELEARAVVLHMGKVAMENTMKSLMKLYDEKKIQTEEGKEFIEKQKAIRAKDSQGYLEGALGSLEKLAREAERRGIFLGVENRYNIQEFPNLEEFKVIFKELAGSPVRYWHDIGHATSQENLGITKRGELLENFGDLLTGVHLHGCRGYNDHYAPGSGEEDYALLKKFLKPETIRVVETHHRATREEMLQGLEFLKEQRIA
jgi:sugar phosphate isomerase/epimerase